MNRAIDFFLVEHFSLWPQGAGWDLLALLELLLVLVVVSYALMDLRRLRREERG